MRTFPIPKLMTEVSFNLEAEPGRPFLEVYAVGYRDLNEKTGFPDIFIHYIEVKYKGRRIEKGLRRLEFSYLWDMVQEKTVEKLHEEINNKIYESD